MTQKTTRVDNPLNELNFLGVKQSSGRLTSARETARMDAVKAIRELEDRLAEALGGERLRGLPNLHFDSSKTFNAARLRGAKETPVIGATLCLTSDGIVCMVTPDNHEELTATPVEDKDLQAEDLEHFVRLLGQVIPQHIQMCDKSSTRYEGISGLAARVKRCLATPSPNQA